MYIVGLLRGLADNQLCAGREGIWSDIYIARRKRGVRKAVASEKCLRTNLRYVIRYLDPLQTLASEKGHIPNRSKRGWENNRRKVNTTIERKSRQSGYLIRKPNLTKAYAFGKGTNPNGFNTVWKRNARQVSAFLESLIGNLHDKIRRMPSFVKNFRNNNVKRRPFIFCVYNRGITADSAFVCKVIQGNNCRKFQSRNSFRSRIAIFSRLLYFSNPKKMKNKNNKIKIDNWR